MVNFDVTRDMNLNKGRPAEVVMVNTDKKIKRQRKEECRFFRKQRIRFTEFLFLRGDGYTIIIRFRSVICLPTNPEIYNERKGR